MLSPDFMDRITQLSIKEQGTISINRFFDLCMQEFDNEEDQAFIRWLQRGYTGDIRDRLDSDTIIVLVEYYLPLYVEMQQLTLKDNWQ